MRRRVAGPGGAATLGGPRDTARWWQGRALVALALTPVALVAAMVVGEALLAAQGHEVGAEVAAPIGPTLVAAVPALLIGVSAPLAAAWCGAQAAARGHPHGRRVVVVGVVLAVGFVALNVLGALVGR